MAWGGTGLVNKRKLNTAQKRAISILPCAHNTDPFSFYQILHFDNIYKYFTLLKLFYMMHSEEENIVKNHLFNSAFNHHYITRFRSNNNIILPFFKKSKSQQCFIYKSVTFWNELPHEFKNIVNFIAFKKKLKAHLISNC